MMKMTLQNVVFPNEVCGSGELFFLSDGETALGERGLVLKAGAQIRTNTYMNLLDEAVWGRYTHIDEWELRLRVKGRGRIRVYGWSEGKEELISESRICSTQFIDRVFSEKIRNRKIYFQLISEEEFVLQSAKYNGSSRKKMRNVHLSLVICTYHRTDMILRNIEKLKGSGFFRSGSQYSGGLDVRVIDNGSELQEATAEGFKIIHNPNTGGSGGFARGVREIRREKSRYKTTHIIFMDDDVDFIEETFYRLYALLRSVRNEHCEEAVGGRMFRKDRRQIQYTALEIWNGGRIVHAGGNRDMTVWENVVSMNEETGEYSGWWFACYPAQFAEENLPMPFFLHCDDVEYGLRFGRKPVVLNGIQVWHETYEYRRSTRIKYYDTRNSLIVNSLYGIFPDERAAWEECRKWLDECWSRKEYDMAYAVCAGMWDYLKGGRWFMKEGEKPGKSGNPIRLFNKYRAAFFWRIVFLKYRLSGRKAFLSYKAIKELSR